MNKTHQLKFHFFIFRLDRFRSIDYINLLVIVTLRVNVCCFFLFVSDNVKAFYRRAKAHVGAWNPDEAKKDFQKCLDLDKSLTKSVQHDLEQLNQEIKLNEVETKLRYKNLFS